MPAPDLHAPIDRDPFNPYDGAARHGHIHAPREPYAPPDPLQCPRGPDAMRAYTLPSRIGHRIIYPRAAGGHTLNTTHACTAPHHLREALPRQAEAAARIDIEQHAMRRLRSAARTRAANDRAANDRAANDSAANLRASSRSEPSTRTAHLAHPIAAAA